MQGFLAATRPGCVGSGWVEFPRFREGICDLGVRRQCDDCGEVLEKRFREFLMSGMCHLCQAWYFREPED